MEDTRLSCQLTASRLARHQQVSGGVQVAVVHFRLDAQDVAHQRVDVDRLEGAHLQVLLEGWAHGPEEGLHVHLLVVEAVLALVDLNREILQGHAEKGRLLLSDLLKSLIHFTHLGFALPAQQRELLAKSKSCFYRVKACFLCYPPMKVAK